MQCSHKTWTARNIPSRFIFAFNKEIFRDVSLKRVRTFSIVELFLITFPDIYTPSFPFRGGFVVATETRKAAETSPRVRIQS